MRLFLTVVVIIATSQVATAFTRYRREAQVDVSSLKNCEPKSGNLPGCKCLTTKDDKTITIEVDLLTCKAAQQKSKLNAEFKKIYGGLKENCFPRPKGGCRCNDKDDNGQEVERKYDTDAECKILVRVKRGNFGGRDAQDQNVRDPVREKAQQNYAAVINELKDKFRGLREGCYPRPKGCLCVIGKNPEGREITERRMKDADCKCKPNERSAECPAPAA